MEGGLQLQLLLNDGHEDIDRHGDPDLSFHGVRGSAVETLDAEMLLYPLKEELDLPAALVQRADGECGQQTMVGQKHQVLAGLWIAITDATQLCGVVVGGIEVVERDALIADQAAAAIDRCRVHTPCIHIALGAGDKEAAGLIECVETSEVQ